MSVVGEHLRIGPRVSLLILVAACQIVSEVSADGIDPFLPPGNLHNAQEAAAAALGRKQVSSSRLEAWRALHTEDQAGSTPFRRFLKRSSSASAKRDKSQSWTRAAKGLWSISHEALGHYVALAGPQATTLQATLKELGDVYYEMQDEDADRAALDLIEREAARLSSSSSVKYQRVRSAYATVVDASASEEERRKASKTLVDFTEEVFRDVDVSLNGQPAEVRQVAQEVRLRQVARLVADQRIDFESFSHRTAAAVEDLKGEVAALSAKTSRAILSTEALQKGLVDTGKRLATVHGELGTRLDRHHRSIELMKLRTEELRAKLSAEIARNAEFRVEAAQRLDNLEQNVLENEEALGSLGEVVDQHTLEIAGLWQKTDLQDGLIYQLYPPSDRASLLKQHPTFMSTAFPEGSDKRAKEIAHQEARAAADEWVGTLREARQNLSQVRQLALNVGLKGKDLERADKILRYVDAAAAVAIAYAAPSPTTVISAAVAVTGLFAKKRPKRDPKFEAIMSQFGLLHKRLDQIVENQVVLAQNQAEILKNQQQILDAVAQAYSGLTYQLADISESLNEIRELVEVGIELQRQHLGKDVVWYRSHVLPLWSQDRQGRLDRLDVLDLAEIAGLSSASRVPLYDLRSVHYRDVMDRNRLWRAVGDMRDFLTVSGKVSPDGIRPYAGVPPTHPVWWVSTYCGSSQARLDQFEQRAYRPLLGVVFPVEGARRIRRYSSTFHALISPSRSFDALREKASWKPTVRTVDLGYGVALSDSLVPQLFSRLLHSPTLAREAATIMDMTAYVESTWRDGDAELISALDQVTHLGPKAEALRRVRRRVSERMLRGLLLHLDLGVAQHAILAGDVAIPRLNLEFEQLLRQQSAERNVRYWSLLLGENRLLWRNLFCFAVREHLASAHLTIDALVAVSEGSSVDLMKKFFPPTFAARLERGGNGRLSLFLGEAKGTRQLLMLPPLKELYGNSVKYPTELHGLLRARAHVLEALQGFEVHGSDRMEDRACLEALVFGRAGRRVN